MVASEVARGVFEYERTYGADEIADQILAIPEIAEALELKRAITTLTIIQRRYRGKAGRLNSVA